jgi:hypothetical protein
LLVALVATAAGAPLQAQVPIDGGPDPATVRVRIGPLMITPTISLTNLGIDKNVFNEAAEDHPKQDFTLTLSPATDLWLRIGRTWLTGKLTEDINWYQKYASERSTNNSYSLGWRVPLNRLLLRVNGTYLSTRDRPGFEIDTRSQRSEAGFDGSAEVRVLAKTYVGVTAQRRKINFDEKAAFRGTNIHDELNRVASTNGISIRHQLTPLTSVSVGATREHDQFDFSPLRDSTSTAVAGKLQFDPLALIKGSLSFGYRDFQPTNSSLPGYRGTTAAINLSYTLLGSTRFTFLGTRDIDYSYDVNQPYFLHTGFGGSIAQQVFGPVDVVGRFARNGLAYRDRAGAVVEVSQRIDHVNSYGAGLGYRMGKELRLGFNVDKTVRSSALAFRRYQGLKIGTAVTYGL